MKHQQTLILSGFLLFFCAANVVAQDSQTPIDDHEGIRVATALNHLTVLEFGEPVTLVAAGGSDFQIERQDNKVFIKPLKSGISTNLFVWTASHRFSYELEPAGEVNKMNFAIDNSIPESRPVQRIDIDQVADLMLTQTFLNSERVDSSRITTSKNRVTVRILQVFRTKNALYIHYSIENHSATQYRVLPFSAYELLVGHANVSLLQALRGHQLDEQTFHRLHDTKEISVPIGHAEAKTEELSPGETSNGVIAIRQDLNSPSVLQLVFDGGVNAVVVL